MHPIIDLPIGGVPKQTSKNTTTKAHKEKIKAQEEDKQHLVTRPQKIGMFKTWIPKEITSQISAKEKSNLVWIAAKRIKSETYEQYIVSKDLIKAHGYYHGQTKLWLPRVLLQSQAAQRKPLQEYIPQHAQPKKEWRPMITASDGLNVPQHQLLHQGSKDIEVDPKETN